MTRRISRQDAGNIVFTELSRSDSTLAEGCKNAQLTASQWHNGMAYIRDVLGEVNSDPITYDARTRRYALAMSEPEVDRYIGKRVLSFLIQIRRLYDGSFVPSGMKLGTQLTGRFHTIDKQITRLITDLDDLRKDIGVIESDQLKRRAKDRAEAGLKV